MHIWSLSQHLLCLGHKVVVVTHAYADRKGVRYMAGGLKVYYCPILPMTDQDALPTFLTTYPLVRHIFIREQIDIVHAHQATSTMANESVVYASLLGLPSVYTDHSLFALHDLAGVILNRVLETTLSTADATIAVSHICRTNLILRANLDPQRVHVVPNAIDPSKFTPDPSKRPKERIRIVVVYRLVYRKGVDLLVGIIPKVCQALPQIDFLVGGDGNKFLNLQEMVEQEQLEDRVQFLGSVPHEQVCDVLCQGHIFLNCSLTESFCIAILEAACCGLLIVSTDVGGIPEVLEDDMILMAKPNVDALMQQIMEAASRQSSDATKVDPFETHERIKSMYSWEQVAADTLRVYDTTASEKEERSGAKSLLAKLRRYSRLGVISGLVACLLAVTMEFWACVVDLWQPVDGIDVVHEKQACVRRADARHQSGKSKAKWRK